MEQTSPLPWRDFETYVARLFQAAGYTTQTDLLIDGQQIDIIATKTHAFGLHSKILIECKHSQQTRSISNQLVQDFLSTYLALKDRHHFTYGMIVTDAQFSRNAIATIAHRSDIKCTTLRDLEEDLSPFVPAYQQWISEYRRSPIFSQFIDIGGIRYPSTMFSPSTTVASLLTAILSDLSTSPPKKIFLLGDFGCGKTTLSNRLLFEIGSAYLARRGESTRPVLLTLRDFSAAPDLDTFVTLQAKKHLHLDLKPSTFWQFSHAGRLTVLLDGFDEILTNSDRRTRFQYFASLLPIIQSESSVVITSRATLFQSFEEIEELIESVNVHRFEITSRRSREPRLRDKHVRAIADQHAAIMQRKVLGQPLPSNLGNSAVRYEITLLSEEQVIDYLKKRYSSLSQMYDESPREIYELIRKVYDLSDLISRPLLLEMLVEVLAYGPIDLSDPGLTIGASALYQNYVNMHLDRDWEKGEARQGLSRAARLRFARALAVIMLKKRGTLEVDYSDVIGLVRADTSSWSEQVSFEEAEVEEVITDLRVCAFLKINYQSRFSFIHKSFMEFFVADEIRCRLPHNKAIELLDIHLNWEILYFLGGFCLAESDVRFELLYQLQNIAPRRSGRYRENVIKSLLYAGWETVDLQIENIVLESLKFTHKDFKRCSLKGVHFDFLLANTISFEEGECENVTYNHCDINSLIFTALSGHIAVKGSVGKLVVGYGTEGFLWLEGEIGRIEVVETRKAVIAGSFKVGEFHVETGRAVIGSMSDDPIRIERLILRDAELEAWEFPSDIGSVGLVDPVKCHELIRTVAYRPVILRFHSGCFENCKLVGVSVEYRGVVEIMKQNSRSTAWGLIIVWNVPATGAYYFSVENKKEKTVSVRAVASLGRMVLLNGDRLPERNSGVISWAMEAVRMAHTRRDFDAKAVSRSLSQMMEDARRAV